MRTFFSLFLFFLTGCFTLYCEDNCLYGTLTVFEENDAEYTVRDSFESEETDNANENDTADDENGSNFNPLAGMDETGRIPKAAMPPDITDVARWRYIPEGRIKPGNIVERFMVTSFFSPFVFYDSDIGTGGGVSITDIDFRSRRRKEFATIFASYTSEGQQGYGFIWRRNQKQRDLPTGGIIQHEAYHITFSSGYYRTLTRRFFGLGSDTTADDETSYLDELYQISLKWRSGLSKFHKNIFFDIRSLWEYHNLSDGRVSGVPSTADRHPHLFKEGDNYHALWLGASICWDTRDSRSNPYTGGHVHLGFDAIPHSSANSYGAVASLGFSRAWTVPPVFHDGGDKDEEHPPTDSFAVSAWFLGTVGHLPFHLLPSLGGGNTLRGYIANRFTDQIAWHSSSEYRFWVLPRGISFSKSIRIERLGFAFFVDLGSVAPNTRDLFNASVRYSYGLSFRVGLERSAIFRFDYGWAPDSQNFTVRYGLAF